MTLTIVGAGAVGGTVGAYLSRKHVPVRLVDTNLDHLAAMKVRGLTIRAHNETFTVPVDVCSPGQLSAPLDVVLLAVKVADTADAVRLVRPHLAPEAVVVSLQDGLCERIIANLVGAHRTLAALVDFSAEYVQPGLIAYGDIGSIYLGHLEGAHTARVAELQTALSCWGKVEISDTIRGYLWGRLAYAAMLGAATLAAAPLAETIGRYRRLMIELATEVCEVADHEGVIPQPYGGIYPALCLPGAGRSAEALERAGDDLVNQHRGGQKVNGSLWRDVTLRHDRAELEQHLEMVAEVGAAHHLTLPLTWRLLDMSRELCHGKRTMSWDNLSALEALLPSGLPSVAAG